MKTFYLFFCCCISTITLLQAQVNPGFMGRKFFLEVGTTIGPRANAVDFNSFNVGSQRPPLMPRLNVDLAYTLGRQVVGRLGWSHLYFDVLTATDVTPSGGGITISNEATHAVYANDIHFAFDFYFSSKYGSIAPIGAYFSMGARVVHTDRILIDGTTGITRYPKFTAKQPQLSFGLDAAYGYRMVIANRFLLSLGISGTLFPQHLFTSNIDSYDPNTGDLIPVEYRQLVGKGLTQRYSVGGYLSVGVFLTR